MVNSDSQPVRRISMEAQLYPVAPLVGVHAANFEAPSARWGFEIGSVEVDKKLVSVGYGASNGACEADFSDHAGSLCKFSASMKRRISLTLTAASAVRTPRYGTPRLRHGYRLRVKSLNGLTDTEGLASES